jgi:ketosteroid isomerase-like protein
MMRSVAVALIVALVPAMALAQTPRRNESAEVEVAQLERDLHDAQLRNDVAAVNWFLARDHYSVDAAGRRLETGNQGKGPFNVTPEGERWEKVDVRDQRVRVLGNTALSTFLRRLTVRGPGGRLRTTELVSTHVWMNREGRWQLVLAQATPVPGPG